MLAKRRSDTASIWTKNISINESLKGKRLQREHTICFSSSNFCLGYHCKIKPGMPPGMFPKNWIHFSPRSGKKPKENVWKVEACSKKNKKNKKPWRWFDEPSVCHILSGPNRCLYFQVTARCFLLVHRATSEVDHRPVATPPIGRSVSLNSCQPQSGVANSPYCCSLLFFLKGHFD